MEKRRYSGDGNAYGGTYREDAQRPGLHLGHLRSVVLATRHGSEDLAGLVADDGRWSHIAHGTLLPLSGAPVITGTEAQIAEKLSRMTPVDGKPLHFTVPGLFAQKEYASLELEPFAGIHDSRYSFYWQSMTDEDYTANLKKREEDEKARLELDRRTVDLVILGSSSRKRTTE